ncbi:iron-siderophore ABC transporter substrate-binding protein [Microbacterium sp. 179-B 1A2 NHS]|uniref:iron-siderophore ABC transporter substrate-binding protein n=1 Tax=Microbacterium sp. 179-B 1A2 NHS TaxID=3142383 RepID=UPI0039A13E21
MPRIRTAAALVAASLLALTGCASASTPAATAPAADDTAASSTFPVTVEHAFGETVIEEKPERVASVAWGNHEVPIALGIVPVGMSKATWGDDDGDGVLPWVEDALAELGGDAPALFDETDGIPFEEIADTQPDVILASYSGLSQEDYDTLSKIAPVVAYPEVAWGTSYEDMIRLNSAALGLAAEGDELIAELHDEVDTALASHPGLAESAVLFSWLDEADLSKVTLYTDLDTRPGFLSSLGLPLPSIVEESSDGAAFYAEVSSEEADRFEDVDVFVTYGDPDGALVETLQADPLLSQIPAIADGRIAILENNAPLAASANPSPLSISWGIDDYFTVLADALNAGE